MIPLIALAEGVVLGAATVGAAWYGLPAYAVYMIGLAGLAVSLWLLIGLDDVFRLT